ncbi:MAG: hypothetical protein EBX52_14345, partial [Proteobacteria bacterium]|nr:hypothetical protein [Pseudomonadota bacterium]
ADIKKDDAPDFNKIMGDLLKQMNPEAKDMKETKENPTEAVYRRLDLLPAHQIESNKDLSLFIRVGYRYRKKSTVFDEAVKPPLPGKSSGSTAP